MEAFIHQLAVKALNGSTRDQIALFKLIEEYAPEVLKESEVPQEIIVRLIQPDPVGQQPIDDDPGDLSFLE